MIRLAKPSIEEDDLNAVRKALASGFLVQGPCVSAFEKDVADYIGVQHAIAVSNCTAALHLALLALDVRLGDIVIVTAYSWVSTANVIELCNAQPVFVDIRPDTFNIDPQSLETTLLRLMSVQDTTRRVRAILPVHTFGQMADMPVIMELAERYGLPVVEDAACALGAALHGRQAGTWGTIGCFSFHPRKAVTTGEGGIITTNDPDLAFRLRALRNHGQDPNAKTIDFIMPGFNYRMTEFQAALGQTQMAKLDRIIASRRQCAALYDDLLSDANLQSPKVPHGGMPVYQSYVALLPEDAAPRRAEMITHLKEQGIETNIGTWHIPLTTYYRTRYDYSPGDFPMTDRVFNCSLALPIYEGLTSQDQRLVIDSITAII